MKHIFLLLAYGDNLTSLSLLGNVTNSNIRIHGTSLTKEVSKLLEQEDLQIHDVFKQIPAFYDVKKCGVMKSLKDFWYFIQYVRKNISKHEALFFEKNDFRYKLLKIIFFRYKMSSIHKHDNFYSDKRAALSAFLNVNLTYQGSVVMPEQKQTKTILINPTGRVALRNLEKGVLESIVMFLTNGGYQIHLIDHLKLYSNLSKKVYRYYDHTSLTQAVTILKSVDLYCGPDSLFIHLAYVFNTPYFVILNYDSSYFLPPKSKNCSFIKSHPHADKNKDLIKVFEKWLEFV